MTYAVAENRVRFYYEEAGSDTPIISCRAGTTASQGA
jgi:hypothetical protein